MRCKHEVISPSRLRKSSHRGCYFPRVWYSGLPVGGAFTIKVKEAPRGAAALCRSVSKHSRQLGVEKGGILCLLSLSVDLYFVTSTFWSWRISVTTLSWIIFLLSYNLDKHSFQEPHQHLKTEKKVKPTDKASPWKKSLLPTSATPNHNSHKHKWNFIECKTTGSIQVFLGTTI